MSTTKQFTNIKAGKRHQIDATARGYYDFRTTVVPQPNKPLSYNMKVYDGLNYAVDLSKNSVRPGEINFDGTVLPYVENNTLTKTNYCFGNSGTTYNLPVYNKEYTNVEMNGNPTIIDGMVSNFSSENYLKFLRNKFTNNNELIFKFKLNTIKNCAIFHCEHFVSAEISETSLICYNWQQSTAQTILDSVETNKWYWVKVEITDLATRKYSISTDGVTYIEKLSTIDTSAVLTYQSYNYMYIGNSTYDTSNDNAVDGFIDLNESKITIGENTINLGDTTLFPKYDLTFNANSSASYIKGSSLVGIGGNVTIQNIKLNPIDKIKISYKYESGYNEIMRLGPLYLTATAVRNNGILPYLYYKTSESETSFSTYKQLGSALVKDQWYNIEITMIDLNNLKVGFSIGENNEEYTYFDITDGYFTEGTYECTINGSSCNEINFSGLPGLTQLTESKTGIFKDYEDNGKSKTLNAFSSNNELVVLSPNENIVDYTWLGTVNIPKHIINWDGSVEPTTEGDIAIAFNNEVASQDLGSDIYVNSGQGINEYYYTAYPVNDSYKTNSTIIATISKKSEDASGNTLLDFDRKEQSKEILLDVSTNQDNAEIILNSYEPTTVQFNINQDNVEFSSKSYNDGELPSSKYSLLNFKFNVDVTDDEVEIVVDGIKYKLGDLPVVANIESGYGVKVNKTGYKPYQTIGRKWYSNVININLETEE